MQMRQDAPHDLRLYCDAALGGFEARFCQMEKDCATGTPSAGMKVVVKNNANIVKPVFPHHFLM